MTTRVPTIAFTGIDRLDGAVQVQISARFVGFSSPYLKRR